MLSINGISEDLTRQLEFLQKQELLFINKKLDTLNDLHTKLIENTQTQASILHDAIVKFMPICAKIFEAPYKMLLLPGETRSGKTAFCYYFIKHVFDMFSQFRTIPFYIDLDEFNNIRHPFINDYLQEKYGFTFENICELKNTVQVVFIFDHYGNKKQFYNLYITQQLSLWNAKTIIITDNQHLTKFKDYKPLFLPYLNQKRRPDLFLEIHLPNFRAHINMIDTCADKKSSSQALSTFNQDRVAYFNSSHVQLQQQLNKDSHDVNKVIKIQAGRTKIQMIVDHGLNQILLSHDYNIMSLLADKLKQDPIFKAFLFEIIEYSKIDIRVSIAAANAITALNNAKVSFNGRDFSHVKIPGAVLDQAILNDVDFSYADLTGVSFLKAYARNVNVSHAQLKDIKLGEYISLAYEQLNGGFALHREGDILISGFDNQTIFWSTLSGEILDIENNHIDEINKIVVSNDGKWIAISSLSEVVLVQYDNKQLIFKKEVNDCEDIAFSFDSLSLAVLHHREEESDDNSYNNNVINIWNVAKGELLAEIWDEHGISAMAFSNKSTLATSNMLGVIKIWNVETQRTIQKYGNEESFIKQMQFSPNEKWLAVYYNDLSQTKKGLHILDITTGNWINYFSQTTGDIFSLQFSPDGNLLAFTGRNTLRMDELGKSTTKDKEGIIWLWNINSNNIVYKLINHALCSLQFSSDSEKIIFDNVHTIDTVDLSNFIHQPTVPCALVKTKILLVNERSDLIQVWDAVQRRLLYNFIIPRNLVKKIIISEDQNLVAFTFNVKNVRTNITLGIMGVSYQPRENDILIWPIHKGVEIQVLNGHTQPVDEVLFSYDNKWLASVDMYNEIRIWDLSILKIVHVFNYCHPINLGQYELKFSYNNKYLAASLTGQDRNVIDVIDLYSGQKNTILNKKSSNIIGDLRFSNDSKYLIFYELASNNHCTFRIELATGKSIKKQSNYTVLSDNGMWYAVVSDKNIFHIYRVSDNYHHLVISLTEIEGGTLCFSQNSNMLAVEKAENKIEVWNLATKQLYCECYHELYSEQENANSSHRLTFLNNDKLLVLLVNENIHIWDMKNGKSKGVIEGLGINPQLSFYDNDHVISISRSHTLLWEYQQDDIPSWSLVWHIQPANLFCKNMNLENAQGLSAYNFKLLRQKQAIGQPHVNNDLLNILKDDDYDVQLNNIYKQGLAYANVGDNDKAIRTFLLCRDSEGTFLPAAIEHAWCLFRKGMDSKKYLTEAKNAFQALLDNNDPVLNVKYALFLFYQKKYRDVINRVKLNIESSNIGNILLSSWDEVCLENLDDLYEERALYTIWSIDTESLSYYLMYMAYLEINDSKSANLILIQYHQCIIDRFYEDKLTATAASLIGRTFYYAGESSLGDCWFAYAIFRLPTIYNQDTYTFSQKYIKFNKKQLLEQLIEQTITHANDTISQGQYENIDTKYNCILKLMIMAYREEDILLKMLSAKLLEMSNNIDSNYHAIVCHMLATTYHVISRLALKDEKLRIKKDAELIAAEYFLEAIKLYKQTKGKLHSSICTQYALFEIHINDLDEAMYYLDLAIRSQEDNCIITYNDVDKMISIPEIHNELKNNDTVEVNASQLAYYLMINVNQFWINQPVGENADAVNKHAALKDKQDKLLKEFKEVVTADFLENKNTLPLELLVSILELLGHSEAAILYREAVSKMKKMKELLTQAESNSINLNELVQNLARLSIFPQPSSTMQNVQPDNNSNSISNKSNRSRIS